MEEVKEFGGIVIRTISIVAKVAIRLMFVGVLVDNHQLNLKTNI